MDRIRIERFGTELLALDPDAGLVHRIAPADVRELAAGRWEPYVGTLADDVLDAALAALDRPRWDRRRVLSASGGLAAAGISTVLLPSAAMAASLYGVAFGTGYDTGTTTFVASDGTGSVDENASYLTWTVPDGVTEVQVVAWGTSGGVAQQGFVASPNTGTPGRGVYAVASFGVAAADVLVISFSSSELYNAANGGGGGGQAVGVGDLSAGSSGDWLLVAGGGGGGGEAGYNVNSGYDTSRTYRGGDGGDAGTGGDAGSGTAGTGERGTTLGGGGGTLSAGGAESAGATDVAGDGGANQGPTTSSGTTGLGEGGTRANTSSSGGAGGGGYFGGGGAGNGTNETACGGGGGGSSYVNTAKRAVGTQSRIETFNRAIGSFAKIDLYW